VDLSLLLLLIYEIVREIEGGNVYGGVVVVGIGRRSR